MNAVVLDYYAASRLSQVRLPQSFRGTLNKALRAVGRAYVGRRGSRTFGFTIFDHTFATRFIEKGGNVVVLSNSGPFDDKPDL